MGLMQNLLDLYEKNMDIAGILEKGRFGEPVVLLPLYHTTVIANITVGINRSGDFLYANPVIEEDRLTIIPVTEKSAARTAGAEPHPLCDNLKYLAGDYMEYADTEKGKDVSSNFQLYMKQLERWAESEYTHEKVNAIYRYLCKASLMKDLVQSGILKVNKNGRVSDKEKFQNVKQTDCFVRFAIEGGMEGEYVTQPECWRDVSLMNAYIAYIESQEGPENVSALSGKVTKLSYLHPKKIRNEGDGAKLFSANDDQYFTYRGRFCDREEAFCIGYRESQQVHNALKWIIRKQGRGWNGLTVVTWETEGVLLPDWYADTDTVCDTYQSTESWGDEEEENAYAGTNPLEAERFFKAVEGYGKLFSPNSQMILVALDAATTGRLSIIEYEELAAGTYLSNVKYWHESCGWIFPKCKGKKYYEYYGVTGVKDIADILYGVESNGKFTLKGANEKMYAEVCKRLIPCIFLRKNIPNDMVNLALHRASSPMSFESEICWKRSVALACSFIRKKYMEQKKEEWTVALNTETDNRNYLYGRLLAVADRVEYRTMEKDEERMTNAKRYMSAFAQKPFRTWKILEERIQPYYQKLSIKEQIFYSHLIEEISWMFIDGEFEKNDALDGLYLLGFHNQAYVLRNKEKENTKDE